jgi:hypothetical protein
MLEVVMPCLACSQPSLLYNFMEASLDMRPLVLAYCQHGLPGAFDPLCKYSQALALLHLRDFLNVPSLSIAGDDT